MPLLHTAHMAHMLTAGAHRGTSVRAWAKTRMQPARAQHLQRCLLRARTPTVRTMPLLQACARVLFREDPHAHAPP